ADRIAHVWDNSSKHPATGMYSALEYDPLYWRWLYDGAAMWLGLDAGAKSAAISYPAGNVNTSSLPQRKLANGADYWPAGYAGEGRFQNRGWIREIIVEARTELRFPASYGGIR